jgi:hypothetical protein
MHPSHFKNRYYLDLAFSQTIKNVLDFDKLKKAMSLNPDYLSIYYNLGICNWDTGDIPIVL